jgi:hypothetical protein
MEDGFEDVFKQIFSIAPQHPHVEKYYNVVLDADKLGFLKTFLKDCQTKLEEAYKNCESDDEDTPWSIEQVLKALDEAKEV